MPTDPSSLSKLDYTQTLQRKMLYQYLSKNKRTILDVRVILISAQKLPLWLISNYLPTEPTENNFTVCIRRFPYVQSV